MSNHVFINRCIDFSEILNCTTLEKMLKVVHKQSKTEEAKKRVDFAHYKDYGSDQWSPIYFGMFVEWLGDHFLNHYGHLFNIQAVKMHDSIGEGYKDYGIDGEGLTIKRKALKESGRDARPDSPVYIQVKGTLNSTKEYKPNDGNRLPNFGCNAFSQALKTGYAYQARYILFTTGKGLHYSMDTMFNGLVEVIGRKKIEILMNNDTVFLNRLRISVGLPAFAVQLAEADPEYQLNITRASKNKEILLENS
jgi:hypothetical protein